MAAHVVVFEPHGALFVEDNDPLVFYRALAGFAKGKLAPGGALFAEIHEDLASATLDLFKAAGFQHVALRKDMQGKDRMIKAG
jgi:release factor glutamine methyltransferase